MLAARPRFWLQLIWLSIQQQITYRTAMLAGLATNIFFGILRAALLTALYGSQTSVNGLSLPGVLSFVAITQGLIAFLTLFGSNDLMKMVYSGEIAGELLKPASLFWTGMARDFGRSLVNLIVRGVPLLLIFQLFFPIQVPERLWQWIMLAVAILLGWMLSYAWRFLVNLSAFWTQDGVGVSRIAFTLSQVFSGFVVPLRLYPDWFARFSNWTPFSGMINTPLEIYMGVLNGSALLQAILLQVGWLLILFVLCDRVYRLGIRRLVIQGG